MIRDNRYKKGKLFVKLFIFLGILAAINSAHISSDGNELNYHGDSSLRNRSKVTALSNGEGKDPGMLARLMKDLVLMVASST